MRKQPWTAFGAALAGAVTLMACADSGSPTMPAVGAPSASITASLVNGNCRANTLMSAIRAYAPSGSDPLVDLARALTDVRRDGGTQAQIEDAGLSVLARIAELRLALDNTTADEGAAAAQQTIFCMNHASPSLQELTSSISTGPQGGVFSVRGGATDPEAPVVARDANPLWGSETQPAFTWNQSLGRRALIYAYRVLISDFTNEQPAVVDADDPNGTAFDMSTVPALTPVHRVAIGVCVEDPTQYRILNESEKLGGTTFASILQLYDNIGFCADGFTPSPAVQTLAQRVVSWLAPKPLYASALLLRPTGGLPSGYSRKAAIKLNVADVPLTITRIGRQKLNVPFVVEVRALSPAGTPIADVAITLDVAGNNGLGSDGVYEVLTPTPTPTDAQGYARITITLNKTGSYTLRANGNFGDLDGGTSLPTQSKISNAFNVVP